MFRLTSQKTCNAVLEFLGHFFHDAYYIFQDSDDDFEIILDCFVVQFSEKELTFVNCIQTFKRSTWVRQW